MAATSTSWPGGTRVTLRSQHLWLRPQALQAALSNPQALREEKEMERRKAEGQTPHFLGSPDGGPRGPQRVAVEAEAELRTWARSWASPPATRGWPARCGRRPRRTGPWGRRRSACRRRTGSRRAQTGPRWKAGGSGGGTRGRCSRGHPGCREAAVRDTLQRATPRPLQEALLTAGGSNPGCSPRARVGLGQGLGLGASPPPRERSEPARGPRCHGVGFSVYFLPRSPGRPARALPSGPASPDLRPRRPLGLGSLPNARSESHAWAKGVPFS